MSADIEIKGIREGLLVTLGEGQWPQLRQTLLERIAQQREFLHGAKLTLQVGNQIINAAELGKLRDQLAEQKITLWAVVSNSPTTESAAQALGLATRLSKPAPERNIRPLETHNLQGDPAIFAQRTLRSGHSIKYEGHIIILGDVNPGAEIIAGGNVVIWGRLRGTVHAGAQGDQNAMVCALDLSPTQLRIAEVVSITPKRRGKPQPEIARLIDGQVVAEPWILKGKLS